MTVTPKRRSRHPGPSRWMRSGARLATPARKLATTIVSSVEGREDLPDHLRLWGQKGVQVIGALEAWIKEGEALNIPRDPRDRRRVRKRKPATSLLDVAGGGL